MESNFAMSRRQPSRATKSVAFAFLEEDAFQTPASNSARGSPQSTDENDNISPHVTKMARMSHHSNAVKGGGTRDGRVRTRGEVMAAQQVADGFVSWTFKHVVDVYGDMHDLYYADNGEKFTNVDW